jgi:hypothetical protein
LGVIVFGRRVQDVLAERAELKRRELKAIRLAMLYGSRKWLTRCCRCGVGKYEHQWEMLSRDGHPFFNNNLEMLEYYDEQKTKANHQAANL